MNFKIINEAEEWNKFYDQLKKRSILSSFKYVNAASKLENGGECFAAVYQKNGYFVFHPLIKRKISKEEILTDLVSVYDFSGFWFNTEDQNIINDLISNFDKEYSKYCNTNDIVAEFSRIYPFNNIKILQDTSYNINLHNSNVVINLYDRYDVIFKNYNPKRRNKINQSLKNKLTFVKDNDIQKFLKIYYKNLDRVTAAQFYYFSVNFFKEIENMCDIFYVYDENNEVCAGHIYLKDNNKYFLFLFAGVFKKLNLRPNCFAINEAIKYSKSKGYEFFHLGSGNHQELQYYKESFSKTRLKYYTIKKIFKKNSYDHLVSMTNKFYDDIDSGEFFPEYRKFDLPYKPKEFKIEE
jgi:hypothetical protein